VATLVHMTPDRFADDAEAAVSAAIVEGYRRVPPATPDGWGDPERLQDASTQETLQQLDDEEAAAGCGTW
jgi:hypothetical protein